MGRKAKFDGTTVPTGRGKKAKKQGDPTFPKGVLGIKLYNCKLQFICFAYESLPYFILQYYRW